MDAAAKRESDLKSLTDYFKGISKSEIESTYDQSNRDSRLTYENLIRLYPRFDPKRAENIKRIKEIVPLLTDDQIQNALDENDGDVNKAINQLVAQSYKSPQMSQYRPSYRPQQQQGNQRFQPPPPPNIFPQQQQNNNVFKPTKSIMIINEQKDKLKKENEEIAKKLAEMEKENERLKNENGDHVKIQEERMKEIENLRSEKNKKDKEVEELRQKTLALEACAISNEKDKNGMVKMAEKLQAENDHNLLLLKEKDEEKRKIEEESKEREKLLEEKFNKSNTEKENEIQKLNDEKKILMEKQLQIEKEMAEIEERNRIMAEEKNELLKRISEQKNEENKEEEKEEENNNDSILRSENNDESEKVKTLPNPFGIQIEYTCENRSIISKFGNISNFGLSGKETIALVSLSDMTVCETIPLFSFIKKDEIEKVNDDVINNEVTFKVPFDGMFDVRIAEDKKHIKSPLSVSENVIIDDIEIFGEYNPETKKITAKINKKNIKSGITLSQKSTIGLYIFNRIDHRSFYDQKPLNVILRSENEEDGKINDDLKLCDDVEFDVKYDGFYDLRIFDSNVNWLGLSMGHPVAKSAAILVGPDMFISIEPEFTESYTVKLQWDNSLSTVGDWIGLYSHSNNSNTKNIISYKKIEKIHLNSEKVGMMSFDIPRIPDVYEFRYFFAKSTTGLFQGNVGYFCSGYSDSFKVKKMDRMSAKLEGQILIVNYCCPSVNPAEANVVAICKRGDDVTGCDDVTAPMTVVGSMGCNRAAKNEGVNRGQVSIDLQKQEYRGASQEERGRWVIKYVDARGNDVVVIPFPLN